MDSEHALRPDLLDRLFRLEAQLDALAEVSLDSQHTSTRATGKLLSHLRAELSLVLGLLTSTQTSTTQRPS